MPLLYGESIRSTSSLPVTRLRGARPSRWASRSSSDHFAQSRPLRAHAEGIGSGGSRFDAASEERRRHGWFRLDEECDVSKRLLTPDEVARTALAPGLVGARVDSQRSDPAFRARPVKALSPRQCGGIA